MASTYSRRTRASYAVEVKNTSVIETPIEKIHTVNPVPSSWSIDSMRKKGVSAPDNIRLTPFGHERTDYTYADSGSYIKSRVDRKWTSPEMCRLPLNHPDWQNLESLSARQSLESQGGMKSTITQTRSDLISSKAADTEDEDETGSRYSTISSNSSARMTRSRCKIVQGEWCTHQDCGLPFKTRNKTSLSTTITEQRNTNNTTDQDLRVDLGPPVTPSSRVRSSRRSSRSTTKIITIPKRSFQQEGSNSDHHSETYVYTYVPQNAMASAKSSEPHVVMESPVDNGDGPEKTYDSWSQRFSSVWSRVSTNNSANPSVRRSTFQKHFRPSTSGAHTRGWIARNIFGLEHSDSVQRRHDDSSMHFVSSDAEEVEPPLQSHTQYPPISYQDGFFFNMLRVCRCGACLLKTMFIEGLAFLLAFVYALSRVFMGVGKALFSFVRRTTWSLLTVGEQQSTFPESPSVHPRLRRFFGQEFGRSSLAQEPTFCNRIMVAIFSRLKRLAYYCSCLLGWLCILVPILLLLAFLFAPVAVTEDEAPPVLPPFISDSDCKQTLLESPPAEVGIWAVAKWRFRCLYHRYFIALTPAAENRHVPSSVSHWWTSIVSRLSRPHSTDFSVPKATYEIHNGANKDLLAQLASFSQVVNRRLDILTKNLQSTDDRMSRLVEKTDDTSTELRLELVRLRSQLDTQAASMQQWHADMNTSQMIVDNLNLSDSVIRSETEQLIRATIESVNHTVASQFNSLMSFYIKQQDEKWKQHDANVLNLSLLLASLRFHVMHRLKSTKDELFQLRSQLRILSNRRLLNDSESVVRLRATIDQLANRLTHLEQVNTNSMQSITEEINRCTRLHAQSDEQCRRTATESVNAAISGLSEKLTIQIADLVNEELFKQLGNISVGSVIWTEIDHLIRENARTAVENALKSSSLKTIPHIAGKMGKSNMLSFFKKRKAKLDLQHGVPLSPHDKTGVQILIDDALQRFAADRIGMPDFALESAGGSIVSTRCTQTYTNGAAVFSLFGISLARLSNSPRTILQPGNNPSDCWPFHGSTGEAVIRLSAPIVIRAVTLEHLPRVLAPNGRLDSAPREFQIKALASESDEEGKVIGSFEYDIDGPPIQTFAIKDQEEPCQFISFVVLNNHGHPQYTCVYRLRVHGDMVES